MIHRLKQVSAMLACGVMPIAAVADTPTIDQLAPDNTVLVVSLRNADETLERFKRTRLWDLWQTDQMVEARGEMMEELDDGLERMLDELGVDRDTLQPPTGMLGMAVFSNLNEETGMPQPGFLLIADYGDHADKTAELFDAALRKAEEEDELEIEERDVMGRTVRVLMPMPDAGAADEDGMNGGQGMGGMGGDPEQVLEDLARELFFAREGSAFMLCSNESALRGAFESWDGEPRESLAQREDFQITRDRLGEAPDGYAAVMTRDLGQLASSFDPMGMTMMLGPMLQRFIGDIRTMGVGYRLDAPTAMVESTSFVYMPNGKAGLTALLDTEHPRRDVPEFITPSTVSYTSVNFEMSGLGRLVNQVMQMMMPMPPQQGEGPSPQEVIQQLFSYFGSEMYIAQMVERPLSATSMKQLFAMECTSPKEFDSFLSAMGPQAGMEGRDFLGHRLYTMDPAMMSMMMPMPGPGMGGGMDVEPQSIGIAGRFAFLGPTTAVEQALRTVGVADNPTLAGEPDFRRALGALSDDDLVGWGYSDLVGTMEAQAKITQMQMEAFLEELRQEDPDLAEEFAAEDMGQMNEAFDQLADFDYDLISRYVGPMVWELHATEDGFVAKSYLLGVEDE